MTFFIKGVCDLGSHYYYLIIIFYRMRNALKSTYSNVEIQNNFRGEPRTSRMKVSEGGEAIFSVVRGGDGAPTQGERRAGEGMVPRKFEHPPA